MNILYLLNILIIFTCVILHIRKTKWLGLIFVIEVLFLIVVRSFVVPDSVSDLNYYIQIYDMTKDCNIAELPDLIGIVEPFYLFLNYVCSRFSTDYSFFLLLYNIFLFYSYYKFIKNYSSAPYLSCILTILIMMNQSVYVVRQHLAIAIILFSYKYILERNLLKYIAIIGLATCTHYSAAVFTPIYFCANIENKHKYIATLISSSAILIFTFGYLLSFVAGVNEKYAELYINTEENAPVTNFLIQFCFFVTTIYFCGKEVLNNQRKKIFFTVLFFGMLLCLAGFQLYLVARLALYFTVVNIVIVANNYYWTRNKIRGLYIFSVLLLLYIIYHMQFAPGIGVGSFDFNIHPII